MNTRWVLIEFESLQMIITVLESYKLVSNELNSCISFHSYNICVPDNKLWIQKIGQLNVQNRLSTSKMETEKQKFLISFHLRWKIRFPKSCGRKFQGILVGKIQGHLVEKAQTSKNVYKSFLMRYIWSFLKPAGSSSMGPSRA